MFDLTTSALWLLAVCARIPTGDSTKVWDGGAGTSSWHDARNWFPDGEPVSGDNVIIDVRGGSIAVDFTTGSSSIGSLMCAETLSISGGALAMGKASQFSGQLNLVGGTIDGEGTVSISGGLLWKSGSMTGAGEMIVEPGGVALLETSAAKVLTKTLNVRGAASISGALTIHGVLHVAPEAELALGSVFIPGSGVLFNEGTLFVNGASFPLPKPEIWALLDTPGTVVLNNELQLKNPPVQSDHSGLTGGTWRFQKTGAFLSYPGIADPATNGITFGGDVTIIVSAWDGLFPSFTIGPRARVIADRGVFIRVFPPFLNEGLLEIRENASFVRLDDFHTSYVNGGVITIAPGGLFQPDEYIQTAEGALIITRDVASAPPVQATSWSLAGALSVHSAHDDPFPAGTVLALMTASELNSQMHPSGAFDCITLPAGASLVGTPFIQLLTVGTMPMDLDGNQLVDGADLGLLLGDWGACAGCKADVTMDGVVNGADLGVLLSVWSPAGD